MFTDLTVDTLLEGLIMAIDDDIIPALGTAPKAHATALMMQSVIQGIRQLLPVQQGIVVEEHNAMLAVHRDLVAALGDAPGAAAERIRERSTTLGRRSELPALPDTDAMMVAHHELTAGLESSIADLDELQRAGVATADAALNVVRAHLAPRYQRDVATIVAGAGFIGRG